MPVRLEALPEGTCMHAHVPAFQLTAEAPYAPLCTYLETLLTHVWYPTTVGTLRCVGWRWIWWLCLWFAVSTLICCAVSV